MGRANKKQAMCLSFVLPRDSVVLFFGFGYFFWWGYVDRTVFRFVLGEFLF